MDPHEIWQENKRWIVGILLGVVLFFIADTIIGSVYGSTSVVRQTRSLVTRINSEPMYDREGLSKLQAEADALGKLEQELMAAVAFTPRPRFDLKGKGLFHLHFDEVSREVRARLLASADRVGADLAAKDILWPTPTTPDDTQAVLHALDLLDDAMARVFTVAQQVRDAESQAQGLVSIDEIRVEAEKRVASRGRRRVADASDRIREQRISFRLRADADTITRVLESFKAGPRPVPLGGLHVRLDSKRPGDPLQVSGVLVAVQVEAPAEDA